MSQIDGLRRYLEAALALGHITRARAEEAVRDLIQTGEVEGARAQEWVENLVSINRERYEAFVFTVRNEVRSQLSEVGFTNMDELARRVANILEKGQAAARKAAKRGGTATRAKKAGKAGARKAAPKRAPAKKAAKKTIAKKATAKRAPAKKAATSRRTSA